MAEQGKLKRERTPADIELPVKQKRMTRQKALIWEILSHTKSHPTAEWVYEEARKVMPSISLGTVYRNLQMLVADGMAQELNYGKGFSRFDANSKMHYHFVCGKCGKIYDIAKPLKDGISAYAEEIDCGEIHCYRLEFYGTCKDCLQGE